MRTVRTVAAALAGVALASACCLEAGARPPRRPPSRERAAVAEAPLGMTPAVACRSVNGFEDYEPLPGAALTADEKLLVYFQPHHFRTERRGDFYQAHLTQDGRIRRRGEPAVLQRKDRLLDYSPRSERPLGPLFLKNAVSLKGLKPGEYDFDIILHDALGAGPGATATQTLKFRVIPAEAPDRPAPP